MGRSNLSVRIRVSKTLLCYGLHVDANGMGKMFDLPGLSSRRGTKKRPSAFARIVVFVECPGSDHLPYQDVQ
jgi:hypothetical protein